MDKELEEKWKEIRERKSQGKNAEQVGLSIISFLWALAFVGLAALFIFLLMRKIKGLG